MLPNFQYQPQQQPQNPNTPGISVPQNQQPMEPPVYTVIRGFPHDIAELRDDLAKQIVKGNKDKIDALKGKLADAKHCYGGAFYTNSFNVSTAIDLTEIAFCGPFKEISATYRVRIDIFRSKVQGPMDSVRIGRVDLRSVVMDTDLFWIPLAYPIRIHPNIWHMIQFCLDNGPETSRCESTVDDATVQVGHNEVPVRFTFLRGSMQMPQLKFKLPSKEKEAEALESEDNDEENDIGNWMSYCAII